MTAVTHTRHIKQNPEPLTIAEVNGYVGRGHKSSANMQQYLEHIFQQLATPGPLTLYCTYTFNKHTEN